MKKMEMERSIFKEKSTAQRCATRKGPGRFNNSEISLAKVVVLGTGWYEPLRGGEVLSSSRQKLRMLSILRYTG